MPNDEQTLGQALRARREQLGLSQAEVAERLRTTQGNLSRWERDVTEPRDTDTYVDLASFLDVPIRALAGLIATSALQRALSEIARLQARGGAGAS